MLANTLVTNLAIHPPNHTVDGLVEHYNTALALSLDSVAPLITRLVSFARPAPWFTPELRRLKSTGRRLKRLVPRPAHLASLSTAKPTETMLRLSPRQKPYNSYNRCF